MILSTHNQESSTADTTWIREIEVLMTITLSDSNIIRAKDSS